MTFYPKHIHLSSSISAASQTTLTVPPMQVRVGSASLETFSNVTLDVNADASWDFGQSITTWQPNTAYTLGQWVRPTAVFSPLSISGCSFWLDATQGVSQSNNKVSQWSDLSPTSGHVLQATENSKPTIVSTGIGNLPTIRFNGSNSLVSGTINSPAASTGVTMFSVSKLTPVAVKYQTIFTFGSGTNYLVQRGYTDNSRFYGVVGAWKTGYSSSVQVNNYQINTHVYDGTQSTDSTRLVHKSQRVQVGPVAFPDGSIPSSISTSTGVMTLGTNLVGDISEIIIFNRTLTSIEIQMIECYLSLKYGVVNYAYKCTSPGTSLSSESTWGVTVNNVTTESGGPTWTAYYDYKQPVNRSGKDFYYYSCIPSVGHTPKFLLSANSTYPHGYDATNSRKIGGFHCLCASVGTIANHSLTGYLAGAILPTSIWWLTHRAASGNNAGMVYDDATQKWYGIYLPSLSGSTAESAYNGTISDTITWFNAVDYCANGNNRLLKDDEFTACATGSPEATNIYGGADPVTTGGHVDTAGVRIISNIGCEDCTGAMNQWLDEQSYRFDAAVAHTHTLTASGEAQTATSGNPSADVAPAWSWKNQTGGKGQLYTQGTYGTAKMRASGRWDDGAYCGSLSRTILNHPWDTSTSISYRFCCESKEL